MSVRTLTKLTICVTLVLGMTAPAFAQYEGNANARLRRLENEIQTLSRAVFKGETPPSSMFDSEAENAAGRARNEVRFSQIEEEMRNLTGRMEEQSYEIRRLREKLDQAMQKIESVQGAAIRAEQAGQNSAIAGMDEMRKTDNMAANRITGADTAEDTVTNPSTAADGGRLQAGDREMPAGTRVARQTLPDQKMSGAADEGDRQDVVVAGQTMGQLSVNQDGTGQVTTNNMADDPATAYEQAFSQLKNNDYDAAQTAFEAFIKRYPDHTLAPNAMYWLGETFYVRTQYERAARIFAEAYQKYPEGPKGPDNLLKLALSLAGTGDKKNACLTLVQLERQYPAGTGPVLSRAAQEKDNLGCK